MKYITVFSFVVILFSACATQKSAATAKNVEVSQDEEKETYELVVFDPEFESWFTFHSHSTDIRSLEYYKNWNRQYVSDWNSRAMSSRDLRNFNTTLSFDPDEIDDLEVQRKLFYYFQFVERHLKMKILYGPGPHIVL